LQKHFFNLLDVLSPLKYNISSLQKDALLVEISSIYSVKVIYYRKQQLFIYFINYIFIIFKTLKNKMKTIKLLLVVLVATLISSCATANLKGLYSTSSNSKQHNVKSNSVNTKGLYVSNQKLTNWDLCLR
jgi:hypothetical protein